MADVTSERIYEVLKAVQARLEQVDGKVDEIKQEMQAYKAQMLGVLQDLLRIRQELGGIHAASERHEHRLSRIDRRLELSEKMVP